VLIYRFYDNVDLIIPGISSVITPFSRHFIIIYDWDGEETGTSTTCLMDCRVMVVLLVDECMTQESEKFLFVLDQLKSEFGFNVSESLRKGVNLLFVAKRREQKGRRVAFIDDSNNIVMEIQSL
jgi:hypothetical protein